jgi:hypothetical protein
MSLGPPAGRVPIPLTRHPKIGQIVHYTGSTVEILAAIITGVIDDQHVALHIFYRTGQFDMASVERTDAKAGTEQARGKWSFAD